MLSKDLRSDSHKVVLRTRHSAYQEWNIHTVRVYRVKLLTSWSKFEYQLDYAVEGDCFFLSPPV